MNEFDPERILECALAILAVSLHEDDIVWKNIDWDLMDAMHSRGWISDPVNKSKSVYLTEEGLKNALTFQRKYFAQPAKSPSTQSMVKSKISEQSLEALDLSRAHIVRCTNKLLKELRIRPIEFETPGEMSVRDWHANLLVIERKKCILVTHTLSLYSFFIYGVNRKDFDDFTTLFNQHLRAQLAAEGLGKSALYDINQDEVDLIITKSNNRSVLGSMNEQSYALQYAVRDWEGAGNPNEVKMADYINDIPMTAIKGTWPPRELKSILSRFDKSVG